MPANEPPVVTAGSDEPGTNSGVGRLRAMTQRCVRMHEHPGLLKKALTGSRSRLLIVSPWITHQVIDGMFVMSLEALLRNGVDVTVGYGLAEEDGMRGTDKANQKPAITPRAEKELSNIQQRFDNFKLVFLGNTHRKLLVSDNSFAVVTSFNWLSFRGDPGRKARDEFGFLVTEPDDVEAIFQDGIELLAKGYSGAKRPESGPAMKGKS
jgi:phosphatidylserine/phosphatidylglycerophosphate/cardiolipin synthase-like enzyme